MKTRLTDLLGIRYPILLPGMSWISTPPLVAAVSQAGGLGILATGPLTPAQTRAAIAEVRALTDQPFGIGCTLLMPGARENAEVALAERVPVINFSLGKGDWLVSRCQAYGGKVIATVTTVRHAQSAQRSGVDALLVTGHEAAAHGGAVTSLVLVPTIADAVDLPVIAAGGVADGRGLLAALALGAAGVAMGSRLATTQESPLHDHIKQAVISRSADDTVYSPHFDGLPARYMETPTALRLTRRPMSFWRSALQATRAARLVGQPVGKILLGLLTRLEQVKLLTYFGAAVPRLQAATEQGDLDYGMQFIGQAQGLIQDRPTVQQLFERICREADQAQQRTAAYLRL
jgi:enoyl-[acyl-carrier protein] reductase II